MGLATSKPSRDRARERTSREATLLRKREESGPSSRNQTQRVLKATDAHSTLLFAYGLPGTLAVAVAEIRLPTLRCSDRRNFRCRHRRDRGRSDGCNLRRARRRNIRRAIADWHLHALPGSATAVPRPSACGIYRNGPGCKSDRKVCQDSSTYHVSLRSMSSTVKTSIGCGLLPRGSE